MLNFGIVLFKETDKEVKNEKYEKYRRKRKNYSGREVSPGAASGHAAPMTLMQAAHFHAAQSLLSRGWSRSCWVTTADPKQDPRPPSPILAVGWCLRESTWGTLCKPSPNDGPAKAPSSLRRGPKAAGTNPPRTAKLLATSIHPTLLGVAEQRGARG